MKIVKLTFKNIHSLQGISTINFEEAPCHNAGLILITGSTGAGKSTILDAIAVALYNKIPRHGSSEGRSLEEMITRGEGEASAEVTFWVKGNYYKSTWHLYKAKNKPDGKIQPVKMELANLTTNQIISNYTASVPDIITEITGLDYKQFMLSVMLAQGEFAAFLKSKPNERSSLLEKITGTEIYTKIVDKSAELSKEKQTAAQITKQQIEALKFLSEVEIQTAKNQIVENTQLLQQYKQNIATLETQNRLTAEKQKLQQNVETLKQELETIEKQQNIQRSNFQKLEQYYKALPLQTQLFEYENGILNIKAKVAETNQQNANLETANNQKNTLLEVQKELTTIVQKLENEYNNAILPIINQAQALEQNWKIAYSALEPTKKQKQDIENDQNNATVTLANLEETQTTLQKKLDTANEYMLENSNDALLNTHYQTLADSLLQIANLKKQIDDLHTDNNNKQTEIKKLNAIVEQQTNIRTAEHEKLKQCAEHLASIQAEFNATTPATEIQKNIDDFQKQIKIFENQAHIAENYDKLIAQNEYSEIQKQSAQNIETELRLALDILDKALILANDNHDLQEQKIIFERQKADFETHRQSLKHNEPCPLCGATHHPFAQNKPLLPNTIQVLQNQIEAIKAQKADIQKNINEKSQKWATEKANFQNFCAQITQNQTEIDKLQREFDNLQPTEKITNLPAIQLLLHNTQRSLETEQKAQIDSNNLQNNLLKQQTTYQAQKDRVKELNFEYEQHQIAQINLQKLITDNTQKVTNQLQPEYDKWYTLFCDTAEPFVQKNPKAFDNLLAQVIDNKKDTNELLDVFKKKKEKYEDQKQRAKETQIAINTNQNQIETLKQNIETYNQKLLEITPKYQKLTQEIETLLLDIKQLTQNLQYPTDLEKEKQTWLQKIKTAENNLTQNNTDIATTNLTIETCKNNIQTIQNQLNNLQEQHTNNETKLIQNINKHEFINIAQLKNDLLKPDEANQIERLKKQLETDFLKYDTQLKATTKLLENTQVELHKYTETDNIPEKIAELQQKNDTILQQQGALQNTLDQNKNNQSNHTKLLTDYEIQKIDATNWGNLNDILNRRGKNFSVFVQEITLAHVVYHANLYLNSLNPRYKISQVTPADNQTDNKLLELEIIDTHQANQTRSMKSLSGGETFLTSLALALGLSDLVGKNAHIQTLFIDEGFGTLDQNTLNTAIDTLENLQQDKEKTICLISHVKELQERIPIQIQVNKKTSTHSNIQIISNYLSA